MRNPLKPILLLLLVAVVFSCSPKYKSISVQKGTPPITTQDSNWLAGRCALTYPVDTTKVIVLPQVPDSSNYYKNRADSIAKTKLSVIEKLKIEYKDTCRSAITKYEDGFELGYKVGVDDGKAIGEKKLQQQLSKKDIDCNTEINKARQNFNYKVGELSSANTLLQKEKEAIQAKLESTQGKLTTRTRYLWALLALCIGLTVWSLRKLFI